MQPVQIGIVAVNKLHCRGDIESPPTVGYID